MKRLEFLRKSLAATIASPIIVHGAFGQKELSQKTGVKIINVKPYVFKNALYIKIETDSGYSGWGEGDHENPKVGGLFFEEVFKSVLIGKDPFDSEYLWHQLFFEGFENGSTGLNPGTLAAVDNALWDFKGKILQMPVHKLLGSSNTEKTAVYGSYGRRKKGGFKSPKEMAEEGMEFVQLGYQTIKARMQLYDRDKNPPFNFTYDCIKEVRAAIGDNIDLMVDFNNGYTSGKAIELGLKLYEHFNISAIEEPVSSMNYPSLREVVDALPCDVNAGEHEYNKWQFRDLITVGNPDCINLDLIKCAGISECKKIAGMAHAFDKEIMVHNTRPTLATAASLNLIASISNAAKVQEFSGMRPDLDQHRLFHNSLKFEDGYLFVPQSPGLGLEVNQEAMERYKLNQ